MVQPSQAPRFDLIELLRVQTFTKELESEAVGRYLSNPRNLEAICDALKAPFPVLRALRAGANPCDMPGWKHKECKCELDLSLRDPGGNDCLEDLEDLKREANALFQRLGQLE